jgi:hypothetical protein
VLENIARKAWDKGEREKKREKIAGVMHVS